MLNFNVIFIYWHYFTIANRLEYKYTLYSKENIAKITLC